MRKPLLFFLVLFCTLPLLAQVKLTRKDNTEIDIAVDGRPFSALVFGPDTYKPCMYPLRSADGKIVTRHYPMENFPGESHDHPHHRGLWFTHGNVNGYDFWSPESNKGPNKGRVVLDKILEVKSGKKEGVMKIVFDWNAPSGKTLLTETRTTTIYSDPKLRIMDFDFDLKAGDEKVTFGDTKEGTFAIRLATPLDEPTGKEKPGIATPTGRMTNAEGKQGEKNVWGKRSSWVDYCGTLDSEQLGIAIFDHPGNPKHPTYWHSRSYGLFAANPFGEHDYYNDKSRDGSLTVEPGGTLRFRYRVVIHPGCTADANIPALYKQYAGE